jgi:hypothetical protein
MRSMKDVAMSSWEVQETSLCFFLCESQSEILFSDPQWEQQIQSIRNTYQSIA